MINKQLIGSKYFFSKYNDYTSHDTDYLTIEDNPKDYNSHMRITSTDRKVDYLNSLGTGSTFKEISKITFLTVPRFCKSFNAKRSL